MCPLFIDPVNLTDLYLSLSSFTAITATKEEMDSVGLSNELRDHCAHIRIHYNGCINERDFIFFRCRGLWDELTDCYYNERMHDMMEFEREKRLNRRERRIKEKLAKEG